MSDLLSSVTQTPTPTSKGPCDLPILYRDASQIGLFFHAPLANAEALLEGTSLEPWPVLGRAVCAIYAWEYRDSTVGRYNEVGLGIQVRQRGTSPSLVGLVRDMSAQPEQGIWVLNLPVTTPEAFAAGVEIWGYPKYVTPIETRFDDGGASVRLGDELELSVPRLRGPKTPSFPVVTFTAREKRLLRTVIQTDCSSRWGSGIGSQIRLIGEGPTAASIRRLTADGSAPRPMMAFRTDRFRAVLPRGNDVGPV